MKTDIIFLTGFMGTGKSASGRILAERLGREFIDTDRLIESLSGATIPDIFEKEGEDAFRRLEMEALAQVCAEDSCVVSTGGGMAAYGGNLETMKNVGTVAALTAEPGEILRRVSASKTVRPLLLCDNPLEKIISLLQKRAYYYIKSDILVDTGGKSPLAVASEIKDRLGL